MQINNSPISHDLQSTDIIETHGCVIACKNTYIRLAISALITECQEIFSRDSCQAIRILFIDEQDPLQELYLMQQIEFTEFDYIFCSAFYYAVADRFMPYQKHHFFNSNISIAALKSLIVKFLYPTQRLNNDAEVSHYRRYLPLSATELTVVKSYLALMDTKRTSNKIQSTIKRVSGHKRRAMSKMHCDTNQELWMTLQFLIIVGNNPIADSLH